MSAIRHNGGAVFGRVVLVASLGGMKALTTVLAGLPADFAVPLVVAQHRRPAPSRGDVLAEMLTCRICVPVGVAEAGVAADKPGVTVVPAGITARVDADGTWSLTPQTRNVGVGDAVLISSAAQVPTIAVILTGRLSDGADGCRAVKRHGGRVLVQDPSTAEASNMPANAIATGCVDFVLPVKRLAAALLALTAGPGAADLLTVALPPWASLTTTDLSQIEEGDG